MPKTIREAGGAFTAQASGKTGEFLVDLITPGWGSSGYYSAAVLEQAATDNVFAAGTHMHIDHQSADEQWAQPAGSLKDFAAVLVEDAYWTGTSLQARVRVFSSYAPLLSEMKDAIGVSIRATADVEQGEAEGRKGQIVARLDEAISVDFVTHAGRGGRIVEVLESARLNRRAVQRGVAEATVNDRREALWTLLKDAYGADRTWVWLRDFDDTTVWFDVETDDDAATWQQTYTTSDDDLPSELTGDRTEVRAVTQYVPANPAGQSNTQESKEDTMATTQIEESALADLREKAGRVTTLESERDTAVQRAEAAESALDTFKAEVKAERDADGVIADVAKEHDVTFDSLQIAGLKARLPLKEGALDVETFTTTVKTHAAKLAEARGGLVGFGLTPAPSGTGELSEADFHAGLGITTKGA